MSSWRTKDEITDSESDLLSALDGLPVDGTKAIAKNGASTLTQIAVGGGGGVGTLQQVTDNGATTTNSIEALSFVTTGGLSTEFVKGNGTLDSTSYEPEVTAGGTNTVWHGDKVFSAVVEADITLSDNTTNNVSTAKHGFMSKLPGGTTTYYRGDGAFATPSNVTVPNAYVIQAFTATSYNLIHNLGTYPIVQVLDSTGAVVGPLSIVNNTVNDLTVAFTTSGTYTIIATLGSPQLQNYISTAVDYSALITDRIIEVTAPAKTITLPTAGVSNAGYEYKIDNSSTGAIFVDSQGGETIQGELIQTIPPDSCISVYANGLVWRID